MGISDRDPGGTGCAGGIGASGGDALGDGFNALGGELIDHADVASHGFGTLGGALTDHADAASHGFGALADETDPATVKSDALEEAPTALGEVPEDALDDDSRVCGTTSSASDSVPSAGSGLVLGSFGNAGVDSGCDESPGVG
ncbi:hypothetical protein [Nocardia sp. CA-119907]|uniref:hypothetical protein n=1 Tax=Nocardia sp. CA-119907 TaxID=3239973 RepID=UPI003D985DF9